MKDSLLDPIIPSRVTDKIEDKKRAWMKDLKKPYCRSMKIQLVFV